MNTAFIFFHLPKTAGTSLRTMLTVKFAQAPHLLYPHYGDPLQRSAATDAAVCFIGHSVRYGLHEELGRPGKYAIFLRDPIQRTISWYYHDYLEAARINRPMLPFNAWCAQHRPSYVEDMFVPDLAAAKAVLDATDFIGLQETFEADARLLFPNRRKIVNVNVTADKQIEYGGIPLPDIGLDELNQIREAIVEDQELYDYALRLRQAGHNRANYWHTSLSPLLATA